METETVIKALNTSPITMNDDGEMILEPIPIKYGISCILASMFLFEIINKIIITQYSVKSETFEFWRWKNLFISWIHAGIISLWVIASLIIYAKEIIQDLIAYNNYFIYLCVAFSTGYFFYDFMDICRNNYAGYMWEVLLHHVCGINSVKELYRHHMPIICTDFELGTISSDIKKTYFKIASMFCYNVVISRCIPFNIIALVVEINSFFLHSRKLLHLQKMSFNHWFYRLICWSNLNTFFFFRFGALAVIYHGIYKMGHRVSTLYLTGLWPACIVMHVINTVLFWRLIKSDVIKFYFKKNASSSKVVTNNNEKELHLNDCIRKNGFVQNGHVAPNKEKAS